MDESEQPVNDPRRSIPLIGQPAPTASEANAEDANDEAPQGSSVLWKKVKRNLLFWQAATDVVQVSVFGPAEATPGQTVKVTVFLHTPDAFANVRTLSRAFHHDAELVANAAVTKALLTFPWRGQPHRLNFDLHIPWESPEGRSPGLVSIGLNNIRVGKINFRLNVLPRKA